MQQPIRVEKTEDKRPIFPNVSIFGFHLIQVGFQQKMREMRKVDINQLKTKSGNI